MTKTTVFCDICGQEVEKHRVPGVVDVSVTHVEHAADYFDYFSSKEVCGDCSGKVLAYVETLKKGVE